MDEQDLRESLRQIREGQNALAESVLDVHVHLGKLDERLAGVMHSIDGRIEQRMRIHSDRFTKIEEASEKRDEELESASRKRDEGLDDRMSSLELTKATNSERSRVILAIASCLATLAVGVVVSGATLLFTKWMQ